MCVFVCISADSHTPRPQWWPVVFVYMYVCPCVYMCSEEYTPVLQDPTGHLMHVGILREYQTVTVFQAATWLAPHDSITLKALA